MSSGGERRRVKIGRVEQYILEKIEKNPIHMTLLDPVNLDPETGAKQAAFAESQGTSAIMVGGSTLTSTEELDNFLKRVKEETSIPTIGFPNNINALSRYCDAVWFMCLLNSVEWYYIIGAQTQGALLIKKLGIEPIPLGYMIFGGETAAAVMGRAIPLSPVHGEVASAYGLAAQYLGMRFVYLEAGSGASSPIPPSTVKTVAQAVDVPVVVGGGIRSSTAASNAVRAGAKIIVTGTVAEESGRRLSQVIKAVGSS